MAAFWGVRNKGIERRINTSALIPMRYLSFHRPCSDSLLRLKADDSENDCGANNDGNEVVAKKRRKAPPAIDP